MPDDDSHTTFTSFDTEPSSGHDNDVDTSEHADLKHRIDVDSVDERPSHPPVVASTPHDYQPLQEPENVLTRQDNAVTTILPSAGPGMMVLQWLVYAFWGWTVLSLSGLVFLVVANLLKRSDDGYSVWDGGGIAYILAAVIVLFIISLICDIFYARAEQKHAKSNGTNVIMIIHAVLFSLFGIGSLIMAVFGGVKLLIGDTQDTSGSIATITSGTIIFVIYGFTLLRTLRPRWIKGVAALYWIFMTIIIIVTVALAIVGPAAQAKLRTQDAIIENALPSLVESINRQTTDTSSLPASLEAISTVDQYGDGKNVKKLIDEKLVTYTPGEKLASTSATLYNRVSPQDQFGGTVPVIYHYQLCVGYKTKIGSNYQSDDTPKSQRYPTSVSTYQHDVGKTCYELQTDLNYNQL